MTGLLGVLQFLTRVPIRVRAPVPHAATVPWFPVAGLLIGVVVGGTAAGLHGAVGPSVAAAVAIAVGLLVTGAFHEDGLADVADAFGGGWTPEQRLEILRDPRHGTYGVGALAASIVLRATAAAALATPSAMVAGLVAAHVLGRTAIVGALLTLPTARDGGLGADAARQLRPTAGWASVLAGLVLAAVAVGWWVAPLAAAAVVGTVATGRLAVRKIGGIAGDVLGAVEQVVECLVLVTAVALARRHGLWWS